MPSNLSALDDVLADALERGAVVVTATRRLARALVHDYDARQIAAGRGAWTSADVLPLGTWRARAWRSSHAPRTLLDLAPSRALWERVVHEDLERRGATLLRPDAAAALAMEAHALVHAHRLPLAAAPDGTPEHAAFVRWRRRVERMLADASWIDEPALAGALTTLVHERAVPLPPAVVLAGFDELAPADVTLFAALADAGVALMHWRAPVPATVQIRRYAAPTTADEAALAATWIRAGWHADERVAVVVPDLAHDRDAVLRALTADLAPRDVLTPGQEASIVDVSLGTPLAETPVVHAAFAVLRGLDGHLAWEDAATLLASPFFAAAETERTARARQHVRLRAHQARRLGVHQLAHDAATVGASQTAAAFRALARAAREAERPCTPSRWAARIDAALAAVGWPGERPLDGHEAQALHAWQGTLETLAALDVVRGELAWSAALAEILRLAAERVFQPESRDLPVQVLGPLEAVGLRFDRAWVLGLHAGALPGTARPHPLLPLSLQRRFDLPEATAAGVLRHARALVARLRRVAPTVHLSAPELVEGHPALPSALVTDLALATPEWDTAPRAPALLVGSAASCTLDPDVPPPPVATWEPVRGRTALVRDQSQCPFRAFATHRLAAAAADVPPEDLPPRTWGILVHSALEDLFGRAGDGAALGAFGPEALAPIVTAALDRVTLADDVQRLLARRRLASTLERWIALEQGRGLPFTVIGRELPMVLDLAGLAVRVRLDRVDRLADGRLVVVDYKTGIVSNADLEGDRPREPQLLVYAAARGDVLPRVDGVVWARVTAETPRFAGVVPGASAYPGVRAALESGPAWEETLARWRTVLATLARAFLAGHAAVDPLPGGSGWPPRTCTHCALPSLCRVHERAPRAVP